MQLVLNPTSDRTETRTLLSISRISCIYLTKLSVTSLSLVRTRISFRPLRTQEKTWRITLVQLLNVKNQWYLYLPTYPLNIFSIIYHLFSKEKTIINKYNEIKLNKTNKTLRNNLAYYLLWEKGLQKARKLNSFWFFRFLLQPRFCLCNMRFLTFYLPSRDKTQVCFHSFLENLMRSQRGTRYQFQNLIEQNLNRLLEIQVFWIKIMYNIYPRTSSW